MHVSLPRMLVAAGSLAAGSLVSSLVGASMAPEHHMNYDWAHCLYAPYIGKLSPPPHAPRRIRRAAPAAMPREEPTNSRPLALPLPSLAIDGQNHNWDFDALVSMHEFVQLTPDMTEKSGWAFAKEVRRPSSAHHRPSCTPSLAANRRASSL